MDKLFTDEEMRKMQFLPQDEQERFYRELGAIQLKMRIADAIWEKTREALEKEIDQLIADVHARLFGFAIPTSPVFRSRTLIAFLLCLLCLPEKPPELFLGLEL